MFTLDVINIKKDADKDFVILCDTVYNFIKDKMSNEIWYKIGTKKQAFIELINEGCVPEIEFNSDETKVRKIDYVFLINSSKSTSLQKKQKGV